MCTPWERAETGAANTEKVKAEGTGGRDETKAETSTSETRVSDICFGFSA